MDNYKFRLKLLYQIVELQHYCELNNILEGCAKENINDTILLSFYIRDYKFGCGLRQKGRHCFQWLMFNYPEEFKTYIEKIQYYGRWDDLIGTPPGLSTFANDVNFATTSYVTDTVSNTYIEGLQVDYRTLAHTPTIPSTLVSLTNVTQNLLANGDVLTYESDNTRWINKPLDWDYIHNKPNDLNAFNNGPGYVTESGLLNTISLGELSNVGSGADSSSNGYFLSYLTDYSEWRPIAVSQVASGVLESLSGTDVLNLVKTADGTGSGLDSDFLDGHQSTYFTDGTNITFTGADLDVGTGDISTESGTLAVGNTTPAVPVTSSNFSSFHGLSDKKLCPWKNYDASHMLDLVYMLVNLRWPGAVVISNCAYYSMSLL